MKLEQGQLWKKGEKYFRIIVRERLAVRYKETSGPGEEEGKVHDVTKKEFCRMLQGAELQ